MTGDTATLLAAARREFGSAVRGRWVLVGTAVAIVLLAGYLVLQSTVLHAQSRSSVGLSGQATALAGALREAAHTRQLDVDVTEVPDQQTGQALVGDGSLDALVSGSPAALQVLVRETLPEDLRAALDGLQQQQVLLSQVAQLAQAAQSDVDPQVVARMVASASVQVRRLDDDGPDDGQRLALALVTAVLLAGAVLICGLRMVGEVARERESRCGEVLLGGGRAVPLLSGRVLGAAGAVLAGLAVVAVAGLALALGTGVLTLPGTGIGVVLCGLLGAALGAPLYGAAGIAAGALVPGRHAAGRVRLAVAALPVLAVLLGSALLISDPDSALAAALSLLPPFAPILVPALVAAGSAGPLQVVIALALTAATVLVLRPLAARVHVGGVLHAGPRPVPLRDALHR